MTQTAITAQELRIGNIIWFTDFPANGRIKVTTAIIKQIEEGGLGALFFSPIPLTETLLEDAGFVKRDDDFVNDFVMYNNGSYFVASLHAKVKIYYLHQLQNLYFALTGKELDIKDITG